MNNSTAKAKPKMTVKNGVVYGDALSAQEKKRIVMQKKKDRKAKKVRKSAQQTIPYVEMCRDGICKVNSRLYTKSIAFEDINYQLAQNDDKTAIFENWCDFLNYFDSSIFVQLSFINQKASLNEFRKRINIPAQEDAFNDIRSEYSGMLQSQLTKGNNGLVKKKYITFGIEADSLRTAKPKLERIETDILNNFKTLGVRTEPLSGYERLKVLHDVFNMDSNEPFRFSFDMVARTGLSTKDFIAPTSFDFREGKCFKMGRTIGAVSFLQILAPELNDRMLADFLEMDSNITVNFHIRTIDQAKAIKSIKSKITDLDKMKIEEQKKAVRSGYDMDIIPSDLATFGGEAKRLLQDLQTRNERLFLVTILIMNTATNRQKLENAVFQTAAIAQKYNCALKRLDFQQEEGLMSSLPIGVNQVEIERGLTTSSTAVFVPFTTQELFQGGEALYYGLNALSNNMIMVDRKQLKNPNGLILGTPGSGKSFSAKREMTNAFLIVSLYVSGDLISTSSLQRNRWPRLIRPLRTCANSIGMTASPASATIQRTGRIKRASSSPQRMLLVKLSPVIREVKRAGSISSTIFPLFTTCAQVYSPSLIKSAAEIPCPRANPSAAFVIFPFSSYAARIEGPRFFTSSSGCASAAAVTITASLLGVA